MNAFWRVQVTSTCTHRPVPALTAYDCCQSNRDHLPASDWPCPVHYVDDFKSMDFRRNALPHLQFSAQRLPAPPSMPQVPRTSTWQHEHNAQRVDKGRARLASPAGARAGTVMSAFLGSALESSVGSDASTRSSTSGATGSHGVGLMLSLCVQYLQ